MRIKLFRSSRPGFAASLLMVGSLIPGCASTPPSSNYGRDGRVDPSRTTAGDIYSDQANMADLRAIGDEAGEALAYEISRIPEIRDSPTRIVIELGTLNNKTRTSTQDFEQIQRRLFSKIQRSEQLRNYAMVVEQRRLMEHEYREIMGEPESDLLQEGSPSDGPSRYDKDITYVLQGHFYEAIRGKTRDYWFEFQLTNLGSRVIVFSWASDRKYVTP